MTARDAGYLVLLIQLMLVGISVGKEHHWRVNMINRPSSQCAG